MTEHPAESHLLEFACGMLPDSESEAIEEHIEQCASCVECLESVSRIPLDSILNALKGSTPPEREIFAKAIQVEDSAGRDALLDSLCGTQLLRDRVDIMLSDLWMPGTVAESGGALGNTLADTIVMAGSAATTNDDAPPAPESIGPYRLIRKLGEGGMGTVWLAEQTAPIKRNVAVKLVKRGVDSEQIIARFEIERQTLAMMHCIQTLPPYWMPGSATLVCRSS